jgi:hypothetical protein
MPFRRLLDEANTANTSFYSDDLGLAVFDEPIGSRSPASLPFHDDHADR